MKSKHLTDEILQAVLLKEIQDDSIEMHLTVCSTCREKLEQYQFVLDNVQKIKTETFSFDVSSLVMKKIEAIEMQKEKNKNTVFYMFSSIISIVTLFLLYPYIKIIFNQFKSLSIVVNGFMLVSVVGVFIFLLNDLFRQYKQKKMLLL